MRLLSRWHTHLRGNPPGLYRTSNFLKQLMLKLLFPHSRGEFSGMEALCQSGEPVSFNCELHTHIILYDHTPLILNGFSLRSHSLETARVASFRKCSWSTSLYLVTKRIYPLHSYIVLHDSESSVLSCQNLKISGL